MKGTAKTIGIFGHYGNLNLGDEAIITAVIENIKQRYADAQLYCFSINPQETEQRYGIPSFPIRPGLGENSNPLKNPARQSLVRNHSENRSRSKLVSFIKRLPMVVTVVRSIRAFPQKIKEMPAQIRFSWDALQRLKSIDHLLIAGSNQFLDNFGGPWGFPFTLLRWSILAKLAGAKISYVSVGAGPLEAKSSLFLCRAALWFADYVSFRDRASQLLMLPHAKNGKTVVYPDLAFSLLQHKPSNGQKRETLTVGINVMAIYDPRYWCEPDSRKYSNYIHNLAIFAEKLVHSRKNVFFFGTQKKDEAVIQDVLTLLGKILNTQLDALTYARYSESVYGLLNVFAEADIVVATRFHGTVLSLFSGIPTLGVCYYRKAVDLLEAAGQGDYYVNIEDFDPNELFTKFERLVACKNQEANKLQQVILDYRNQLAQQYDSVLV